jgi:hypothetical protein
MMFAPISCFHPDTESLVAMQSKSPPFALLHTKHFLRRLKTLVVLLQGILFIFVTHIIYRVDSNESGVDGGDTSSSCE